MRRDYACALEWKSRPTFDEASTKALPTTPVKASLPQSRPQVPQKRPTGTRAVFHNRSRVPPVTYPAPRGA